MTAVHHASPPVVDRETWFREVETLRAREKAHTREGDAIAAARRRLPMTGVDATTTLVGAEGPTSILDMFGEHDQLLTIKHMWHEGRGFESQCPVCTMTTTNVENAVTYLDARGVAFAIWCQGPYDEFAPFREFMGYQAPWYAVEEPEHAAAVPGISDGWINAYLRVGDRVFLTYSTQDRGTEVTMTPYRLLDLTVFGRQEPWEDSPEGWPQNPNPFEFIVRDGRPLAQWARLGR